MSEETRVPIRIPAEPLTPAEQAFSDEAESALQEVARRHGVRIYPCNTQPEENESGGSILMWIHYIHYRPEEGA